jgi:hypothetical protein
MTMVSKLGFELMTCSRCGGSGQYSYCQSYGTKCFKCHGTKVCLTAKGQAAKTFYGESLKVPAGMLAVGELLWTENFWAQMNYFATITAIEPGVQSGASMNAAGVMVPYEVEVLKVSTKHAKYGEMCEHIFPAAMVRKGWPVEFKEQKLAEALAYQASLTKAGTVRKAVAKATAQVAAFEKEDMPF